MKPLSRGGTWKTRTQSARYGVIAVIIGVTLAAGGHGTAWADTEGTDSRDTSVSRSDATTGAGTAAERKDAPASANDGSRPEASPSGNGTDASNGAATEKGTAASTVETTPKTTRDTDDESPDGTDIVDPTSSTEPEAPTQAPSESESEPVEQGPTTTPTDVPTVPSAPVKAESKHPAEADASSGTVSVLRAAVSPSPSGIDGGSGRVGQLDSPDIEIAPLSAQRSAVTAVPTAALAASSTTAVETAAITPGPVSPIAQLAALPGRIVNVVLQLVGATTSAGTGPSPFSPGPIADLFFAVFRRLEEAVGLYTPLSGQPVPPTMVYEGPLDTPTPTVAQFLNAATTEYVLGGTPGGMTPFTVNGWPMTSLHLATGSDASVWVTPQNQVIIAYSGTTGGTNLLFNPLIAITQLVTDFQAGFGDTTPAAFTQAVDFAQAVQAEAAAQGYAPEDVFVTGHSLGAWQAQYVAQQLGLNGIGFEGPGLSSTVPGNGANSLFVNTATYGDMAAYLSSDLPGLYPIVPYPYVPGGGLHPHYGPIVMLGDPNANTPMINAARLIGQGPVGTLIGAVGLLGNFFASHLPGVQAYNLDVDQDPGVVPWLGVTGGTVHTGFGDMTIGEFLKAASDAGILVKP